MNESTAGRRLTEDDGLDRRQAKGVRLRQRREGGGLRRRLWAVAGFTAFGLGAAGAVLPILPTTPFLLAAAWCFARSSERLDEWLRSTGLYRTVVEGYVAKRAMTVKSKLLLLVPLTAMLGVSFALMANVPAGRVVVAVIWVAHLVYFGFVVKTDRPRGAEAAADAREVHGAGSGRLKGAAGSSAAE